MKTYVKPWSRRFTAYMGKNRNRKSAYFRMISKWRKNRW